MIVHTLVNSYGVPLNEDGTPLEINNPTLYNGQELFIFDDHVEFQQYLDDNYPSDSGEI